MTQVTGFAALSWFTVGVILPAADVPYSSLIDPKDPHKSLYDVDDESTIISLSDWYHFASPQAPIIGTLSHCKERLESLLMKRSLL